MKKMKKSRFTEEQVTYCLRLAESGTPVADVCRQMGISEATFYAWKKKDASLGVAELRQLRQLQEENSRLKRLVADLTLDKQILTEVITASCRRWDDLILGAQSRPRHRFIPSLAVRKCLTPGARFRQPQTLVHSTSHMLRTKFSFPGWCASKRWLVQRAIHEPSDQGAL
jgi:putative transposase